MRQPINDAELHQELAGFHDTTEQLLAEVNQLLRTRNLETGPYAQVVFVANGLRRIRDSLDAALLLTPTTD